MQRKATETTGEDIKDRTGKTLTEYTTTGRAGENWCVVLWSPTFSNEDGKRRQRLVWTIDRHREEQPLHPAAALSGNRPMSRTCSNLAEWHCGAARLWFSVICCRWLGLEVLTRADK